MRVKMWKQTDWESESPCSLRIRLALSLPLCEIDRSEIYDFTMCNPPFYSSREEVLQSAEAKVLEPNAVCTGADIEMITPGGEAAFVGRMVEESTEMRERCRWFTSMVGKMSSLTSIVESLRIKEIDNYAITELVQGQTRRWVIAWSFGDASMHHLMPAKNTLHQPLPRAQTSSKVAILLHSLLTSVDGLVLRDPDAEELRTAADYVVSATRNSWSRAARRKKQETMDVDNGQSDPPKLVCRVRYEGASAANERQHENGRLVFDWLRGRERSLFESFASHVERKVIAALSTELK
ncbi:hypothetical protein BN946_scf184938.g26 [Trametes cinnabarina]|uniref:U6 small nuclear RNA (adenine-(43)-N(6))-methyltransferase n=1 Tax=Pycnoporus cinnabarinus TaxID=5643 RepID=A0A060S7A7_PYCCI|nr:hypothetical protein BN946_scf184938.g26 [Trametes cinnabarina]